MIEYKIFIDRVYWHLIVYYKLIIIFIGHGSQANDVEAIISILSNRFSI